VRNKLNINRWCKCPTIWFAVQRSIYIVVAALGWTPIELGEMTMLLMTNWSPQQRLRTLFIIYTRHHSHHTASMIRTLNHSTIIIIVIIKFGLSVSWSLKLIALFDSIWFFLVHNSFQNLQKKSGSWRSSEMVRWIVRACSTADLSNFDSVVYSLCDLLAT